MNTISLRIAGAMLPVLAVLLSMFGVATAMREGEVLELEMQRDTDAVAEVVATLLADRVDKRRAIEDLELPRVQIEFVSERPTHGEPHEVWSAAPVLEAGESVGWIVVSEPLSDRDAFVRRALLADGLGVMVSTLVAGVFAVAVGRTLVQARVLRISQRLEEVARDQLQGEPLDLGRDELGQLGVAVESMTQELQRARSRAAEEVAARRRVQLQLRRADRLVLIGRTVAVFAHEVGNPLSVIVGRSERVVRKHADAAGDAGIVLSQALRIAEFVQRLLDYSRHDDGFELVPTPLRPLLEQAVELATDRGRAKGVEVRCATPADACLADVDAHAMVQVMTNLLANAIDATPSGGVVSLELADVYCAPSVERGLDARHLHIAVRDQGAGISASIRDRVFDPFFTTKEAGEGTGLGLSIVAEIVGDHGGFITLDNGEHGGCTATVHLPRAGVDRG